MSLHARSRLLRFHPLTLDRWDDLADLFGARGACGGCWCMWYRLPRREYEAGKGRTNQQRFKRVVGRGAPGMLAYRGPRPVGWCAVAPRVEYRRLETTRTMRGDDGVPVWAILCLYVDPGERQRGLSVELIRRAAEWALTRGAPAVEAYPVIPCKRTVPPAFASQGILSSYLRAGFRLVKTVSASRAIVRYDRRS